MTATILNSPNQGQPVDWVLIATKAYDAAGAAPWLASLVGPRTRLAVLQNGVEHVTRYSRFVAASKILPVVVDMPVERRDRGLFHQRRFGRLIVPDDPNGAEFAQLFKGTAITVEAAADFVSAAWSKLAVNCAGAVSALLLKPASIVRIEPVAAIMRELIDECVAVGRAEGAVFDAEFAEEVLERYRQGPPDAINSMHADRLAGKPVEVDARNGAVVRLGKKHGISTPANRIIAALFEGVAR